MRKAIAPAAAALVVLLAGCNGSQPSSHARTETRRTEPLHVVDRRTAGRLRAWAGRLQVCYRERELEPGPVRASRRRLTIDVDASVPPSVLTGEMLACVSALGKPPAHASFRSLRGRTVVSLPGGYTLSLPPSG